MKIPGADRAIVSMEKLLGYSLNYAHEDGRHKAIVFEPALGITVDNVGILRDKLLEIVQTEDARQLFTDQFGTRYRVDFLMVTEIGSAWVQSGWIVDVDTDYPRLTTCLVIEKPRKKYG